MSSEYMSGRELPFWLDSIPASWSLIPTKRVMSVVKEIPGPGRAAVYDRLSLTMSGVLPRSKDDRDGLQPTDFDSYQLLRSGQLVFKLIDLMNVATSRVGLSEGTGLVSPAYIVTELGPDVEARFAHYYFRDLYSRRIFNLLGSVGVRSSLGPKDLMRLAFVLPPLDEQCAIADYLDQETAQIDALVAKQEEFIRLLRERRRIEIDRAVNPTNDDSPRVRLRYLLQRIDQGVSPQAEFGLVQGNEWGVLKTGCVNAGVFRETEHKRLPAGYPVDRRMAVQAGDVIVSRANGTPAYVGAAAIVRQIDSNLILSDKHFRLVPKPNVDAEYLAWAMNARSYRRQVESSISGAAGLANNLPLSDLKAFFFACPEYSVQKEIVAYLLQRTTRIDTLIAKAEEHIALAKERRSALITAAVTGQFDVRTAKKGARS